MTEEEYRMYKAPIYKEGAEAGLTDEQRAIAVAMGQKDPKKANEYRRKCEKENWTPEFAKRMRTMSVEGVGMDDD